MKYCESSEKKIEEEIMLAMEKQEKEIKKNV